MKKLTIFLLSIIFLSTIASAGMSFFPNPGVPNTRFDYIFNFTTASDCSSPLLSFQDSLSTNEGGFAFADVDISSLQTVPSFLCEYKNGALRKTHNFSDIIFNTVYSKRMVSDNWTDVDGSQMNNSLNWLNETTADPFYLRLDGTNSPTANINWGGFGINNLGFANFSSWVIKEFEGHANLNGVPVLGLFVERSGSGEFIEHMAFNPGGDEQSTTIRRSLAIVDDSVCTGTNATNMQCYADAGGFNWSIDFNTSITGADLGVTDDFEVIGDIRLRDTDGEVHSFNRELEIRDELYNDIIESRINTSYDLSTANLSIVHHTGKNLFVILDEVNFDLGTPSDSIILTTGTNTTPIFNHAFYSGNPPILSKSTSVQNNVPDLAQMLLGDGFDYGSIVGSATNDRFIQGVYNRFFDEGAIYKSDFNITVSSTSINISIGTVKILLDNFDIDNSHSTDTLTIEIHSDGVFDQHINNFDGFDSYGTGEAIGNNKYANIICGISVTESREGVMYCIVQDKPTVEHNKLGLAENDNTFLNFFPRNELIKKLFVPVVRVVIKRTGGGNIIQTLSTDNLFFDVRGITSGEGSSPIPGVTALSQLDIDINLNMQNFISSIFQNITNVDWLFANNGNFTSLFVGTINVSEALQDFDGNAFAKYNFLNNNFNGSGNWTGNYIFPTKINWTSSMVNDTIFNFENAVLTIRESWITSFINSWFSGKTTDDLTQGSTNFYDNQSFNQSLTDGLYADISVTGDNSSWNETHADIKYFQIDGSKNATGNFSGGDSFSLIEWVSITADTFFGDGSQLTGILGSLINNDLNWITNSVSNLVNYYLKSEVYNKTESDNNLSLKLSLAGGIMSGNINMNFTNNITNPNNINGDTNSQVITDLNPISHWTFDRVITDNEGAHDLRQHGGTTQYGDRGAVGTLKGNDASGWEVNDAYKGILGTLPRTLIFWFRTIPQGDREQIFQYGSNGIQGWGVRYDHIGTPISQGKMSIFTGEGNRATGDISATAEDGEFHHYAFVVPSGANMEDMLIYLDGVEVSATSGGTGVPVDTTTGADVHVGINQVNANHLRGNLQEMAWFDSALSENTIQNIYNAQKSRIIRDDSNSQIDWTDAGSDFNTTGDVTAATLNANNGFTGDWQNFEGDIVIVVNGIITEVG